MPNQIDSFFLKKNYSILLVDDSIVFQKIMYKILEKDGYEVYYVNDGKEALSTIQNIKFDLIISDIDMPNMDGIEFVQKARNDYNVKTPIILYSIDWTLEKKALDAGANIFMNKKINYKNVQKFLSELLANFFINSDDKLEYNETRKNEFTIVKSESRCSCKYFIIRFFYFFKKLNKN